MLVGYLTAFKDYLIELLPVLAIGFLLSGLIYEFIPSQSVERHLGGGGIKPVLYSTLVGIILPICCLGSLPVALSLYRKGARLGPVLAFLVATPATSVTALLVAYRILGPAWALFEFVAVIVMGLAMGLVGNLIKVGDRPVVPQEQEAIDPVCGMNVEVGKADSTEQFSHRLKHVFRYAFVDMVKDIGPEMLLALALAALVATVTPVGDFVGAHLSGGLGYLFSLGFGLIMYICATASVPLVHAFVEQGMNVGAGMVILLVGPITSWGALLVLRKEFGAKILAVYLAGISVMSLLLGYSFSLI